MANVNTQFTQTSMSHAFSAEEVKGKLAELAPAQYGLLTPEALMDYIQSRLRGIDEQVQRAFNKQKGRNDLSTKLTNLADALGPKSSSGSGGIKADDAATKAEVLAAYNAAIQAAGPKTDLGAKLEAERNKFAATAAGDNSGNNSPDVADWEVKNFLDTVQNVQQDVNREGELEMIQLQSLMSMRQQALQMCTNMVAGLGQSSLAIAQNVGK